MNLVDRVAGYLNPEWGIKRAKQRKMLNKYEALEPSQYRKNRRSSLTSIEESVRSFDKLRDMARHAEQNSPIITKVTDAFVNNVVGEKGMQVDPLPLMDDGTVNEDLRKQIARLWTLFSRRADTKKNTLSQVQRLLVNHWIVDGEVFAQHIEHDPRFKKQNKLPYIQQLIEPDYLPNISRGDNIVAGIEFDDWLNPLNYYFSRTTGNVLTAMNNLVQVDADKVIHLALKRKINQVRGISKMAPVLNTITDLADYENSERVAAKIAASLVGFIKKEMPEDWTLDDYMEADELLKEESSRMLEVAPGMFAHDLGIGEDIGLIQSNRSATYLSEFSKHMVRSIASGTNSSYSTISNDYNGTYSAQRQELLEQWQHYKVLQNEFGCQYLQPTFMRFVQCCIEAGLIKVPKGVWLIDNAQYLAPVMPWIDPYKEIMAHKVAIESKTKSRSEVITERGGTPSETFKHIEDEYSKDFLTMEGNKNEGILQDNEQGQ